MIKRSESIILFDGDCAFCNYWLHFIKRKDIHQEFNYYSLQSKIANDILNSLNIKSKNLNSIVFIDRKEISFQSDAILKILNKLNFKLGFIISIFPKFIRDYIYDFISKNRYIFNRKNGNCST